MALLLPFFSSKIDADEKEEVVKEIPLILITNEIGERGYHPILLNACYYGILKGIKTNVFTDLGEVEISVSNWTTGEVWSDSFDSSQNSTHILNISGESGIYEVIYTTQNGNIYQGTINIE